MTEPLNRYDVTVTLNRDGGYLPGPAEFAVAAEQAASSRAASVVSAHTVEQIISVVRVNTADRSSAVAVALGRRSTSSLPIFTKRIGPQSGSGVFVAEGAAFPPRDGDRFGQGGLAEYG